MGWMTNMRPGISEELLKQNSIQVLDIILRHEASSRFLTIGRSLFPKTENGNGAARKKKEGGSGGKVLEVRTGTFLSAQICWKPLLNVDVIYKLPNAPSSKRTYLVLQLSDNAHKKIELKNKNEKCTIVEYFKRYKNCLLQHPWLPCLQVGKRELEIYLPAEYCQIAVNQPFKKKLDDSQRSDMIKETVMSPDKHRNKIHEVLNEININKSPVLRNEFNVKVSTEMKKVDARILSTPSLQYKVQLSNVGEGKWICRDLREARNLENNSWTIITIVNQKIQEHYVQNFIQNLRDNGREIGMNIGQERWNGHNRCVNMYKLEEYFRNNKNMRLIIAIIPNKGDEVYAEVKRCSELVSSVLTQCVKLNNITRLKPSTVRNILIKVNAKLNGLNYVFNRIPYCMKNTSCMIVGADVSHPAPEASADTCSIAAVVASYDDSAFRYNVAIRTQDARQERIQDLTEIMSQHINYYIRKTKTLPKRIIFYRDGVSEGQISTDLEKEIGEIKTAFFQNKLKYPNFQPELTFLIVQKRHHVRLFLPKMDVKNVEPGTIVDTEITHPNHIDFYLVSHKSIRGTARPTKYRCVCNESSFTEDQIEELTFYLCHMYARCTQSVSYPAPTYYAHKAAARGKLLAPRVQYAPGDNREKGKRLEANFCLELPMYFI
ncbi:Eukaryotic translation initiation factor 2C 2 [Harpegnathos saltator]|uniref:Eukaryotic translation initiation factor 2C 2 n=1 Tax=Harpegnathos saltator TaxID=610380 RepID=E2C544_HARSA|nr:Eukaryotic translation initiation factor 2C 2 [Harpegnathos saltator]